MCNNVRLRKLVIITICITMLLISSCGKNKSDGSDNREERDTHAYSYLSFEYSDMREDLSNILEDEVIEVRWVLPNGEYRTIDNELVYEIKKKMSEIELEPMEQITGEIPAGTGTEFYLLNGRKVLYNFHIDGLGNTYVNGKVYSNKDEFKVISDYLTRITYNDERIEEVK